MLKPDYLLHISEGAEDIAEQLHIDIVERIIKRMMVRMGRGEDYLLTATDKWNIQVLQDAGYLLEDIQKILAEAVKLQQKEIAEAFEEAGIKALEYDHAVYRDAGLSPVPLEQSPHLVRIMQRNYEATMGEWSNFTRTTAETAQRLFINECDKMYNLVSTGTVSYTEAFLDVIKRIVNDGLTITYPTGHTDTIETATLRCVRTGISQMSGQITDARMEEMDWDIILTSSHLGARVTGRNDYTDHAWWQGKFYSRTGRDKRFPPYSVCGQGHVQGIHGANCRHSHGPGDGENNPFEQYDSEENRRQYELEQRQRALERRIRQTKRQVMEAKTAVDSCKDDRLKFELDLMYQKKAALLKKQNDYYNEFCERNGQKRLQERLAVAKWDRQQAAAARGAAKRYKNSLDISAKQGIIKQRISNGDYSLQLSKQHYLKHVAGSEKYSEYLKARISKGQSPQGKLLLSEEETQKFIDNYSGKGIPKVSGKGEVLNIEFVSGESVIGQYYKNGDWHDTTRAAIHHSKKSSHVVPVEDNND